MRFCEKRRKTYTKNRYESYDSRDWWYESVWLYESVS